MAYSEYRSCGRCLGKILYQLSRIGVPLHVVENVMLSSKEDSLSLFNGPFATFVWSDDDVPVFAFCGYGASVYNGMQKEAQNRK